MALKKAHSLERAACYGNLKILQEAVRKGKGLHCFVLATAADYGQFECFKYAYENGGERDVNILQRASEIFYEDPSLQGKLKILVYLIQVGFTPCVYWDSFYRKCKIHSKLLRYLRIMAPTNYMWLAQHLNDALPIFSPTLRKKAIKMEWQHQFTSGKLGYALRSAGILRNITQTLVFDVRFKNKFLGK